MAECDGRLALFWHFPVGLCPSDIAYSMIGMVWRCLIGQGPNSPALRDEMGSTLTYSRIPGRITPSGKSRHKIPDDEDLPLPRVCYGTHPVHVFEYQEHTLYHGDAAEATCPAIKKILQERHMIFAYVHLTPSYCKAINHALLRHPSDVQIFRPGHRDLGEAGLALVAPGLMRCQSLTDLCMCASSIEDVSVLCNIIKAHTETLTSLGMSVNNFGDAGLSELAPVVQACVGLTSLCIRNTGITAKSLPAIVQFMQHCPKLVALDICCNDYRCATDEDGDTFVKAYTAHPTLVLHTGFEKKDVSESVYTAFTQARERARKKTTKVKCSCFDRLNH